MRKSFRSKWSGHDCVAVFRRCGSSELYPASTRRLLLADLPGRLAISARISTRRHEGTLVSERRIELRLGSFSRQISKAGSKLGAELLWAKERQANQVRADALRIDAGSAFHALQRLRGSDNAPWCGRQRSFPPYPAKKVSGFLTDDLTGSLWTVLRTHYSIRASADCRSLEVVVLDQEAGRLSWKPGMRQPERQALA